MPIDLVLCYRMIKKIDPNTTFIAIFLNILLFILKVIAGLMSGSLALISDAFNSLTDIVASTAIFFAVKMSSKGADAGHPFGHARVQPLVGFVVAILTGILGFEIFRQAIGGLVSPKLLVISVFAICVPIFTILVKGFMMIFFFRKADKYNSPAFKAIAVDARNDVYLALVVLVSLICSYFSVPYLDSLVAMGIGFFILFAGYDLGLENYHYLIGKAPPLEQIHKMKELARKVKGVKGLNDVRAHYVGNYVHVEIHIEVEKHLETIVSHEIGKKVQFALEELDFVDKAFVHIDPV